MFVYSDLVKRKEQEYFVLSVDDSNPKNIRYLVVPYSKYSKFTVEELLEFNVEPRADYFNEKIRWFPGSELEYVPQP